MNVRATRVFSALVIHLIVLLLGGLLIYFIGSGESALAELVREQYADRPAALEDIQSEAVWRLIMWLALSLTAGWVLASIWLNIAESHRPATPAEGAEKRGLWVVLLIVTLLAFVVIGWVRLVEAGTFADLADSTGTIAWMLVGVCVFLAYVLATAMSVKAVMKPSVPFGTLLPNLVRSR